ncbi:phage minor head protein [Acidiphilium angustum]|uniref:phage minor head protein n=1 Tax=Acidiphilium angustum TaxID=523 RepID=UPI000494B46F|nr:phage minor head protein [Acidiphilium angustum]
MTDLSAAQIEQRRNAARARWRERGAAVAGAVGGYAAGSAIGASIAGRKWDALNDTIDVREAMRAKTKARLSAYAAAAERIKSATRSESRFATGAARGLRMLAAAREREVREHMDQHSEPFPDPETGETHWASTDAEGETWLRQDAADLRAKAADVEANTKAPTFGFRRGYVTSPKVEQFNQPTRGKLTVSMGSANREAIRQMLGIKEESPESKLDDPRFAHLTDEQKRQLSTGAAKPKKKLILPTPSGPEPLLESYGIKTEEDFDNLILNTPQADQRALIRQLQEELGLGGISVARERGAKTVTNVARHVPDNKRVKRTKGYPLPEVRGDIRRRVSAHLDHKSIAWTSRETDRLGDALNARPFGDDLRAAMRWTVGGGRRRGLRLGGAAVGLLAGAFAARALDHQSNPLQSVEKYSQAIPALNKAADQPDPDQPDLFEHAAKRTLKAVDAVTGKLAHGVAGAFASWKDAATDDALGNADAPGGLLDRLDEALARGMGPLDDATKAGLQTPTHIVTDPANPDAGDGKSHIIRFGFDLRGPGEEAFIKRYRFGRVREISDEQRRNIRGIMLAAAQRGDAPQTTARRIRDVIGLTAYQAGIVANYRAQLATLDPRALGYELRDHRFDGTVKKAIEAKEPLTEAQIDKMVDAYSRRFLAYRAMTIARTESLRAANNAHVRQIRKMLDADPSLTCVKSWMATLDDRTRPDHVALNRQTAIGIDTPFKCEDGTEIRWPHDPDGVASQIINCRCVLMTSIVPRSNVAASGLRSFAEPYADFWSGPKERAREFQPAGA